MSREYKWAADLNHDLSTSIITVTCVAILGWVGEKAFKISLSEDPSKSVIGFIKMAASVSASNMFLDYIDKKHII